MERQVNGSLGHGLVENLKDLTGYGVDLVDEEDIPLAKLGEQDQKVVPVLE